MSRVVFSKSWQIHAVGFVACVSILVVAYLAGFAPLVRQAAAIRMQKKELVQKRQQVAKLLTSRGALNQQLTHARQVIQDGAFRLRPVGELNTYLAQLTELATASGLTLHEIQPGQVINDPNYRSVPIVMSGTGTYQTCAMFLHKLHGALPDTRLSSLELAASDNTRKPGARFRLDLVWYATPQPKTAGS